jgi:hypothetical protein
MASYSISIPGSESVDLKDGDTLTINYLRSSKLCLVNGNSTMFFPPLPVGVAGAQGSSWSGKAIVVRGTVTYSSVNGDSNCSSEHVGGTVPGTIKIGSGTE